jgi:hypothetical protein
MRRGGVEGRERRYRGKMYEQAHLLRCSQVEIRSSRTHRESLAMKELKAMVSVSTLPESVEILQLHTCMSCIYMIK